MKFADVVMRNTIKNIAHELSPPKEGIMCPKPDQPWKWKLNAIPKLSKKN